MMRPRRSEVDDVRSEAEDSHDFGRDGDVVAVLTRHAVRAAAEAVDDVAELAVVHVDAAAPGDAARVDAERVALEDVVVEHRGEQVVGRADGVHVAREVEVDVLHRDDLSVAAAGGAALDAEDRAEGGLAQSDHALLADVAEAVAEADGRRRLAFAGRGRRDGRDEDELAVGLIFQLVEDVEVDFRLVVAVLLEVLLVNAGRLGDFSDVGKLCSLGNFDVGFVFQSVTLLITGQCAYGHNISISSCERIYMSLMPDSLTRRATSSYLLSA